MAKTISIQFYLNYLMHLKSTGDFFMENTLIYDTYLYDCIKEVLASMQMPYYVS